MPRVKRTLPGFDLAAALSGAQVDRALPIGPQVYDVLRRLIVLSRLPSGAPLHEADIAAALGISRTPVRAAFQQLALEGLVNTWPQVGSVVAAVDRAKIEEGLIIRRALEGEVVRLLCAGAPDWARLDALMAAQAAAVGANDADAFFAADEAFHAALADMAGVPQAWRLLQAVKAHIDRVRLLVTRRQPDRFHAAFAEHQAVLDAVRRRNPEEAAARMAHHVEAVRGSLHLLGDVATG